MTHLERLQRSLENVLKETNGKVTPFVQDLKGQIAAAKFQQEQKLNTTTTILRETPREGPSRIRNLRPEDLTGSSGFGVGERRSTPLRPSGRQSLTSRD